MSECGIGEYLAIAGLPTLTWTYLSAIFAGVIVVQGYALNESAMTAVQRVGIIGALATLPVTVVLASMALSRGLC
jgi:hypothetical protein